MHRAEGNFFFLLLNKASICTGTIIAHTSAVPNRSRNVSEVQSCYLHTLPLFSLEEQQRNLGMKSGVRFISEPIALLENLSNMDSELIRSEIHSSHGIKSAQRERILLLISFISFRCSRGIIHFGVKFTPDFALIFRRGKG